MEETIPIEYLRKEYFIERNRLLFITILTIVAVLSFIRSYSIIPIVGALCCLYLMIEIPPISWLWFFIWMCLGLVLYSFYGRRNSLLSKEAA